MLYIHHDFSSGATVITWRPYSICLYEQLIDIRSLVLASFTITTWFILYVVTNDHRLMLNVYITQRFLTFNIQPPHDLSVAVTVPHFTNIRPGVARLGALYQQPCDGLAKSTVRLQRAVVLQPAVFGRWKAWSLTGQLHSMINHHLSVVKPIQDAWLSIGGVWKEQRI